MGTDEGGKHKGKVVEVGIRPVRRLAAVYLLVSAVDGWGWRCRICEIVSPNLRGRAYKT